MEGDLTGLQHGIVNLVKGKCKGAQLGVFNSAKSITGLQWGFINMADRLNGIQIGFINFHKSGQSVLKSLKAPYFFPVVNWSLNF